MFFKKSDEKLIELGLEALEENKRTVALKHGRELMKRRHTYGFEIVARALDDCDEALAILDQGLTLAPGHWRLLELKGITLSNAGRPEQAQPFYQQALESPDAWRENLHFNAGVSYFRAKCYEMALGSLLEAEKLSQPGSGIWTRSRTQRIYALEELGRIEEAIELGREAWETTFEEGIHSEVGELAKAFGRVRLTGGDHDGAVQFARGLLNIWDEVAFYLLRQADGIWLENTTAYRLMCEGTYQGGPFYRTFRILAQDEMQALAMARAVENEELRESLVLTEVLEAKPIPESQPLGVYWRSPYFVSSKKRPGPG